MSHFFVYLASLGMLLYQSGCPLVGSHEESHSRRADVDRHSMSDGGDFERKSPVKHSSVDKTAKTSIGINTTKIRFQTSGVHIQYNKINSSRTDLPTNMTEVYTLIKQKGMPEHITKSSQIKFSVNTKLTERPATTIRPVCRPDSCGKRGLPGLPCSNGKCTDTLKSKCYCDILCAIFGDCCSDTVYVIPRQTLQMMIYHRFNWKSWFRNNENFDLIFIYIKWSTCIPIRNGTNVLAIRVISKCPYSALASNISVSDYQLFPLCGYSLHLPFVSLKKHVNVEDKKIQIVFKNKYCAHCHGFTDRQVVPWTTNLGHRLSKRYYFPPLLPGMIRKCDVTAYVGTKFSECQHDTYNFSLKTLCSLNIFPALIDFNGRIVNTSQLIHFNETQKSEECETLYFEYSEPHHSMFGPSLPQENGLVLDSLFSFYNYPHVDTVTKHTSIQSSLNHYHIEYPIDKCPLGFYKTGNTCSKEPVSKNSTSGFGIILKVKTLSHSQHMSCDSIITEMLNISFINCTAETDKTENILRLNLKDQNRLIRVIDVANEIFLNTNAEIKISDTFKTKVSDCHTYVMLNGVRLKDINNSLFVTSNRSSDLIPFPFSHFILHIDINKNASNMTLSYCSAEPPQALNCSNVQAFSLSQHTAHNDTIRLHRFNESGHENFNQYTIQNHTLLVCIESSRYQYDYAYLASYISNICMSFSIIFLILLIYYHFVIPRLLNLHGKIVVCFAISLSTAQLTDVITALMHIDKDYTLRIVLFPYICQVLGVLHHYSWICAFVWSAVMSYDICRRFSVCSSLHQQMDPDKGKSRFKKYLLVAVLLPFVIVSTAYIIGKLSNDFYLGYGDNLQCTVYTFEGKLYAFDIPLLVIYVFSIVCFVITLHGMEYARRMGKHLCYTQKRYKRHCLAYAKITLMIGVTWLIAVMAVFTGSLLIGFFSLFVNGLQGMFVFIGFILNVQVRKVILARYRCHCAMPTQSNNYALYSTQISSQ